MSDLIKMIYKVPGQPSHTRLVSPEKMADLYADLTNLGATILVDVSRDKKEITGWN